MVGYPDPFWRLAFDWDILLSMKAFWGMRISSYLKKLHAGQRTTSQPNNCNNYMKILYIYMSYDIDGSLYMFVISIFYISYIMLIYIYIPIYNKVYWYYMNPFDPFVCFQLHSMSCSSNSAQVQCFPMFRRRQSADDGVWRCHGTVEWWGKCLGCIISPEMGQRWRILGFFEWKVGEVDEKETTWEGGNRCIVTAGSPIGGGLYWEISI